MLIQKNSAPEINDIVTVKLVSGEEIVGRMTDRTHESIALSKPVQIAMQPVGPGQMGLGFLPVLGSVEDATLHFQVQNLLIKPVKTGADVSRNYIQATTGLVTATTDSFKP